MQFPVRKRAEVPRSSPNAPIRSAGEQPWQQKVRTTTPPIAAVRADGAQPNRVVPQRSDVPQALDAVRLVLRHPTAGKRASSNKAAHRAGSAEGS